MYIDIGEVLSEYGGYNPESKGLSRKEEQAYAKRMSVLSKEVEQEVPGARERFLQERNSFIGENINLVYALVPRVWKQFWKLPFEDAIGEGFETLVKCAERFTEKGIKFSSYFTQALKNNLWRSNGKLLRELAYENLDIYAKESERRTLSHEANRDVRSAIQDLPLELSDIIQSNYLEGIPYHKIAGKMRLSKSRIMQLQFEALDYLASDDRIVRAHGDSNSSL